jgi:hypothetical protein
MKKRNKKNPIAKLLGTKLYTNRVIPDKRKKLREKQLDKEIGSGKAIETEK